MKRFFAILMSIMLLFGSVSYAKALSNADAQMLFGTQKVVKVDAVTLDKSEMAKTEGEFFWGILFGLAISGITWLNAPSYNDRTYGGRVFGPSLFGW